MTTKAHPFDEVTVLGYQVANCTLKEASDWCLQTMQQPKPHLVVTTNPEIIVQAQSDAKLAASLHAADLTVPDGVGIIWAAKQYGHTLKERVPGVDLMTQILASGGPNMRVFFLGSRPGVAARASEVATERFGTVVAGVQHGYFDRKTESHTVIQMIHDAKPHLLLAALGEGQERFLHENRAALNVPVMIGVGGSLDVLSGTVKRTPAWTRQLGIEWLWRVGLDPKRWHRFPRLLEFMRLVLTRKRSDA